VPEEPEELLAPPVEVIVVLERTTIPVPDEAVAICEEF